MNIVITGSTGFIGRHLTPALVEQGYNILEITRSIEKSTTLFGQATNKHLLTKDNNSLKLVLEKFRPEVCIHLASFLTSGDSYQDMEKLVDSNLLYLLRLLDALKGSGVKFFTNTGTFAEYFKGDDCINPAYLYAATKSASRYFVEYYSNVYGFKHATVVPYTIYGGTDSQKKLIDLIYDSLLSDITVELSPGEQILDFVHVNDVVDFYLRLIKNYSRIPTHKVFKLGTGEGTSIKQLAELMEILSGKKANIAWGAKPYRPRDIMLAVADTSEQTKLFNWKASINLREGLQMYLQNKQR